MIDVKNIRLAVSKIKNYGADKFVKMNGTLAPSNIDGVFHYTSLLPAFDKFILFELPNGNEIGLILSNENITLADFFNNFSLQIAGYNFREDMSRINIDGLGPVNTNYDKICAWKFQKHNSKSLNICCLYSEVT